MPGVNHCPNRSGNPFLPRICCASPQPLPGVDAAAAPAVRELLGATPQLDADAALRLLLSQRASLLLPLDEAGARVLFAAACFSPDPQVAHDAAAALLEACGVGALAAGERGGAQAAGRLRAREQRPARSGAVAAAGSAL